MLVDLMFLSLSWRTEILSSKNQLQIGFFGGIDEKIKKTKIFNYNPSKETLIKNAELKIKELKYMIVYNIPISKEKSIKPIKEKSPKPETKKSIA